MPYPTSTTEAPKYAIHRKGITTPDLASAIAATGQIQCVAVASLVDGEKVTISDGATSTDFVFNVSGGYVPGGGYTATIIEVDVSADVTDQDVALSLRTAVDGALFDVSSTGAPVGGLLDLENDTPGAAGNVAISDTVADAGFTHSGMSGGFDGTAALVEDRYCMNLAGYETAIVQVVPTGGANPSIEVLFWSEAAESFVSEVPALAVAGQGADKPYEVRVPALGRKMLVKVTAIAAGSVDIFIAAFGQR